METPNNLPQSASSAEENVHGVNLEGVIRSIEETKKSLTLSAAEIRALKVKLAVSEAEVCALKEKLAEAETRASREDGIIHPSNPDESQYLNQIRYILKKSAGRSDRTGTGTLSVFGMQSRYSLRNGTIPVLTTKRVFWKGVLEELLWFIRAETDARTLSAKGVKIWDANGSRSFLDNLGFKEREEGDLGPVYGFQWRHFGAVYRDCKTDYSGHGVDQLAEVIRQIKETPDSRRIILSAWNPSDLAKMVLPPCHTLCQFYVQDGELSCQLYQRSGDMGLGVPFNLASYGLLTHMVAHVCGLKTGDLVHTLGDAHVYANHVDALKEQLARVPSAFPRIEFDGCFESIDSFTAEKIHLRDYNPQSAIKMTMAV